MPSRFRLLPEEDGLRPDELGRPVLELGLTGDSVGVEVVDGGPFCGVDLREVGSDRVVVSDGEGRLELLAAVTAATTLAAASAAAMSESVVELR